MTDHRPRVAVPRSMMVRKPPHGSPCTRCGVCCVATLCELGKHIFGDESGAPCPALLMDNEHRAVCGLTVTAGTPQREAAAHLLIGAGDGCDARFNGEAVNHAFHQKQMRLDEIRADEIKSACAHWGMEKPMTETMTKTWLAELHAIREDAAKIARDTTDARMVAAYMAGAVKALIERLLASPHQKGPS